MTIAAADCGPDCRAVKPETDHQVLSEIAGACDPWCDDGDILDDNGRPVEDGKPVPVAVRIEPGGPVTLTFADPADVAEWAEYIDWWNEPCTAPLVRHGATAVGTWLGRPVTLAVQN